MTHWRRIRRHRTLEAAPCRTPENPSTPRGRRCHGLTLAPGWTPPVRAEARERRSRAARRSRSSGGPTWARVEPDQPLLAVRRVWRGPARPGRTHARELLPRHRTRWLRPICLATDTPRLPERATRWWARGGRRAYFRTTRRCGSDLAFLLIDAGITGSTLDREAWDWLLDVDRRPGGGDQDRPADADGSERRPASVRSSNCLKRAQLSAVSGGPGGMGTSAE